MKILYFSIVSLLYINALWSNAWKKTISKDGVTVYKRTIKGSPVIEMKGTAVVNHNIKDILAVVLDYQNYKKWQPNLIEFERIKAIGSREFIDYAAFKLPWPISDRDLIAHTKIKTKSKTKVQVKIREMSHPGKPESEEYVRIKMARAQWNLQSIKSGRATKLQFISRADPSGYIPLWIINWIGKYQVVQGINRVRRRVRQKKHNIAVLKNYKLHHMQ